MAPEKKRRTEAAMKRNEYAGWREVFSFSFQQELKQKSYTIMLIVMCVIILAASPVSTWLKQRDQEQIKATEVSCFTIYDETGLGIDYSQAMSGERYDNMQLVSAPSGTFEAHVQALEESQDSTEVIVHVTYEELGYFNLTFVKAVSASLKDKDYDKLGEDFQEFFQDARIRVVDVSQEQLDFINQPVNIQVEYTTPEGEINMEEKDEGISMNEYYILLAAIVIVMMFVNMSGSQIALSIVTEKSTRVVEYLMINVRPMALIVGKILASLVTVLIQFIAYGISYLLSKGLSSLLFGSEQMVAEAEQVSGTLEMFAGVNAVSLLMAAAMILVGVLLFSIVAGLAGASVSKMEEMAEGLKLYQMTMVIGTYIGIFLCIMQMMGKGSDLLVNICCILPLSAPFVLPGNVLLGKVGMGTAAIGLVIAVLCTVALFAFTARVYESMIFYNGKVLKLKDILQIAKNRNMSSEAGGKEESHHE